MSFDVQIGDSLLDMGRFTAISSDGGAPAAATLGAMVDTGLNVSVDPAAGVGLSAQFGMAHAGLSLGAGGAVRPAGPSMHPEGPAPAVAPNVSGPRQPGMGP